MSSILQKIFHLGLSSSNSYQRGHGEQKKRPSSHPSLTMHLKPTNTYHQSAPTSVALAKITDRVTLHTVIHGAVRPLVQINISEGFLNPVEDRPAKDDRGRKTGEGPKDDPAHIKCTVFGP